MRVLPSVSGEPNAGMVLEVDARKGQMGKIVIRDNDV